MSDDGEEIKWWALWSADSYGNLFVAEAGLTFDESIMLRDSQNGGRGIAAPDRYATRCMGVLSATRIGDRILDEKIAESYRSLTFGETEVVGATPTYWCFGRTCEEWVAGGKIPGRLSVAIDKVDGSLWTDERQEQFLLKQRPDW